MPITLELPGELEERFNALAEQKGSSKEAYLLALIEREIEDTEDYYAGIEVLEKIKRDEMPVYSSEEVRRSLDLED